jgi:hypothetical protein
MVHWNHEGHSTNPSRNRPDFLEYRKDLDFNQMLKMWYLEGILTSFKVRIGRCIWENEVVALLEHCAIGSILLEIGRSSKQGFPKPSGSPTPAIWRYLCIKPRRQTNYFCPGKTMCWDKIKKKQMS